MFRFVFRVHPVKAATGQPSKVEGREEPAETVRFRESCNGNLICAHTHCKSVLIMYMLC